MSGNAMMGQGLQQQLLNSLVRTLVGDVGPRVAGGPNITLFQQRHGCAPAQPEHHISPAGPGADEIALFASRSQSRDDLESSPESQGGVSAPMLALGDMVGGTSPTPSKKPNVAAVDEVELYLRELEAVRAKAATVVAKPTAKGNVKNRKTGKHKGKGKRAGMLKVCKSPNIVKPRTSPSPNIDPATRPPLGAQCPLDYRGCRVYVSLPKECWRVVPRPLMSKYDKLFNFRAKGKKAVWDEVMKYCENPSIPSTSANYVKC